MRELELAGIPSIDPTPPRRHGGAPFPLSRAAFIASIFAHIIAGYALSRNLWPGAAPLPPPSAEFFLFETPATPPPEAVPATPPVAPLPDIPEETVPAPTPRPAPPMPEPAVAVEPPPLVEAAPPAEPPPLVEPAPSAEPAPAPRAFIDFDEERRRAANQVVESRAAEKEYLTFSIDDVAAPRLQPEPDKPSIFDGTGGSRGPSAGQLGQARTKFGHRVSALCNALTGGFSLMGWGSFCAEPSDGEPSGLFPEVRPAYLDLMPECVDTRDTAPALALEAPFPTVKCRLVMPQEVGVVP
jgi:hypothetical protein